MRGGRLMNRRRGQCDGEGVWGSGCNRRSLLCNYSQVTLFQGCRYYS